MRHGKAGYKLKRNLAARDSLLEAWAALSHAQLDKRLAGLTTEE